MSRRIITLALLLALALTSSVWSQTFQSLESSISFTLFHNPFDAAFNPSDSLNSPTFTGLQNNYLFGGLTNFPNSLTATNPVLNSPLELGYYNKGTMPWSALLSLQNNPTISGRSNGTTETTATKPVPATGTTITQYTWTTIATNNTYTNLQARNLNATGQALLGKLGPVNAGLLLNVLLRQDVSGTAINTWADGNRTQTVTHYYDTAAAGQAPSPKTDYTATTVYKQPDSLTEISVAAPFYLPLDKMGLTGSVTGTYYKRDLSVSTAETVTAPQNYAGAIANVQQDVSTTDVTGYLKFNGAGTLTLPPLIGKNKGDRFEVGLNGSVTLNNAGDYVNNNIVQDYTAPGGGGALVPASYGNNAYNTITTKRSGTTGYSVDATAQHYLYFPIAQPIVLGIAPQIEAGVSFTPTATSYNTQSVQVQKVDGNGNGTYTDAADTITTTTTTYGNNKGNGTFSILTQITLPMALKFRPNGWPFGVTLGSEMIAGAEIDSTTTETQTTATQTVVTDGTGATVSTTNTTAASATSQNAVTTTWTFSTLNNLGLNFFLPGNTTLDVILNGSNFFSFDNLTVQAIIPLP